MDFEPHHLVDYSSCGDVTPRSARCPGYPRRIALLIGVNQASYVSWLVDLQGEEIRAKCI